MPDVAVVYRSKTGFARKYAGWIAERCSADLLDGKKTTINELLKYKTIVYGAGLYAAGINGLKLITDNIDKLTDKKLIVFAVGATPVRPEIYDEVKRMNLPEDKYGKIRFFMLRGGFDFNKLGLVDKFLMLLLKAKLKGRRNPTADESGMLAAYSHPLDFTNEKAAEPIIKAILE